MSDIKIMMLGFATPDMIKQAMQNTKSLYDKTLFDIGYPRQNQSFELMNICKTFHWNYQKIENLGCSGNWNYVWRFLGRPDILVGVEPDERATNKSWISRAADCLVADPTLGYVGMGQSHFKTMYDVNPDFMNERFTVGANKLKNYKSGIGWAMGAVSGSFMDKVGMKGDPFYGNTESKTHDAMRRAGFRWGLFEDINSVHICGDPIYEDWKVACADHKTTLSFKDWLTSSACDQRLPS